MAVTPQSMPKRRRMEEPKITRVFLWALSMGP